MFHVCLSESNISEIESYHIDNPNLSTMPTSIYYQYIDNLFSNRPKLVEKKYTRARF